MQFLMLFRALTAGDIVARQLRDAEIDALVHREAAENHAAMAAACEARARRLRGDEVSDIDRQREKSAGRTWAAK